MAAFKSYQLIENLNKCKNDVFDCWKSNNRLFISNKWMKNNVRSHVHDTKLDFIHYGHYYCARMYKICVDYNLVNEYMAKLLLLII